MLIYFFLFGVGASLVAWGLLSKTTFKLNRVKVRRSYDSKYAKFWVDVIDRTSFLKDYIRSIIAKVDIINGFDPLNSQVVCSYFGTYSLASVVVFFIVSKVAVTTAVFLTFILGYLIISASLVNVVLHVKLEKIQTSFKDSLDIVIDNILQVGSFQSALQKSMPDLPKNIKPLYQKLLREYLGSPNPTQALYDFANSLDYVYSYAFVELINLSSKVDSIDSELIFLNKAMSANMLEDKEEKGSFSSITTLYGIIMIFVGIGVVATLIINPIAKDIYFHTLKGNYTLMLWLFGNVAGLGLITAIRKA